MPNPSQQNPVYEDMGRPVHVPVLEDVDESTGRGDDDLAAHPELEALLLPREAADHGHRAHAERAAELDRLLLDLLRQLAGRRHDDGVRALKPG